MRTAATAAAFTLSIAAVSMTVLNRTMLLREIDRKASARSVRELRAEMDAAAAVRDYRARTRQRAA